MSYGGFNVSQSVLFLFIHYVVMSFSETIFNEMNGGSQATKRMMAPIGRASTLRRGLHFTVTLLKQSLYMAGAAGKPHATPHSSLLTPHFIPRLFDPFLSVQ